MLEAVQGNICFQDGWALPELAEHGPDHRVAGGVLLGLVAPNDGVEVEVGHGGVVAVIGHAAGAVPLSLPP
ncbi:hypothetical protein [Paracraurococcus ruber]|uniref:hypothetical protein n=1 Tax=Paracraurococcus ruber TaxID=77675 RepID=UPI001057C03D|nr:hypothetical protein [Paracraurococcus ruber]TDG09383.1 hypothetical protein E2C05_31225 [Paracraurococcus ruber]